MATAIEDATKSWNEAIEAEQKKLPAGATRAQAIGNVIKKDPALHTKYLDAFNQAHNWDARKRLRV